MWSSSCIPVIILLLCQESVELNPLCTPKRGSDAEFVVDFVFFIDHMLGQDAVDRIKYLYKAISCEVPASRRYHLATVDMTADTATVTPWKSSKTFPETLEGGKEAGHTKKGVCHRLRFAFDRIRKQLQSIGEWKNLFAIPLHFVIPVSETYAECNVVDEFRDFLGNDPNKFNAFLDIISINSKLSSKDPGVRVVIGSWNDIDTTVPSLTKHTNFQHVYKMDKMLQQYTEWIRKALAGTILNDVFYRKTTILTTEIPSTTAPPATSVVSTTNEATSVVLTTNEATSVVITTNEATSTVAKTTEASTPLETTEAITSRQQKSSSIEPKTSLTSESILTTSADTTVRPRREFKVLWRKTQTKAAPSRSNEEPSEDGAAQEPLIDEERSSGIQVFHAEKSAGQQPSGSSSGTHHKSQYKPYFIPLLILIIILALIIIFLLICIICLMKLEEKEDYKSEPSSRPSEKKPLLSKSEGTDTKTPKKSPSKKKPEPAPIMVPPPEEEPREEPQPPRDTDSANFAPIIISGKPRKERSHGEGGPGAPGACDQRGGDGQREASEGKGSRDATQDQQAPPAPIKETGSSKERENMPKISTDHMF